VKTLSIYHFVSIPLFKQETPWEPDGLEASMAVFAGFSLTMIDSNSSIKTVKTTEVDHV